MPDSVTTRYAKRIAEASRAGKITVKGLVSTLEDYLADRVNELEGQVTEIAVSNLVVKGRQS